MNDAAPAPTAIAVVEKKPSLVRLIAPVGDILAQKKEALDAIPKVLEEGVDYGKIPGTNKNTLLKPGAERLCNMFGLVVRQSIDSEEINHDRVNEYPSSWIDTEDKPNKQLAEELKRQKKGRWKKKGDDFVWQVRGDGVEMSFGLYRMRIRCRLERQDGTLVAECLGSCSTLESKYIDRPRDCENTVLKMAQKRAHVGAVLTALGLSDHFTQDVEDFGADDFVPVEVVDPQERSGPTRGGAHSSAPPKTTSTTSTTSRGNTTAPSEPAKPKRSASAMLTDLLDRCDELAIADDVDVLREEWTLIRTSISNAEIRAGVDAYLAQTKCHLMDAPFVPSQEETLALEALRKLRVKLGSSSTPPRSAD